MSFKVHLYTLSKRDNSTKRPNANTPTVEYDCILKDGSSLFTPAIQLNIGLLSDPSEYNYARIPAFGRYYFIEDWYFSDSLWTAHLSVDVLATYRSEIGDANLYILRSYAAYNGRVMDNLYPTKAGCTFDKSTANNPWNITGCFVVGIVTADANFGSINYYAMDASQLASLCTNLTDPTLIDPANDFDPTELSTGLQLSLVDPIQYVKSCVMLPVAKAEITNTSAETITVYRFANMGSGDKVRPTSRITKSLQFTIKDHPDESSRGSYVNSSPYSKLTLTLPPFGCIDIDSSVTCNANNLDVDIEMDPITGKGIMIISCNNIILNRIEAQIGVPISLSSVTRDYIGAASSALSGIGGAIAGAVGGAAAGPAGIAAGAIMGGGSGIGNAIESLAPRANTVGTTGSFAANHGACELDFQFFRPVDDDPRHNGRPLCEMRTIKDIPGYILVQDGDVQIAGTASEDSKIRNYLETGFYYE